LEKKKGILKSHRQQMDELAGQLEKKRSQKYI